MLTIVHLLNRSPASHCVCAVEAEGNAGQVPGGNGDDSSPSAQSITNEELAVALSAASLTSRS